MEMKISLISLVARPFTIKMKKERKEGRKEQSS